MVQKALLLCVMSVVSTDVASAQGPRVQPRTIAGRVITDALELLDQPVEIRLEDLTSRVLERTFTDGAGNFGFTSSFRGPLVYLTVEVDGFKPIRQRFEVTGARGANREPPQTTLFLERLNVVDPPDEVAPDPVVDLRQLAAVIPDDAVEEYEKAAEESGAGNYDRAAEHLEKALQLAPEYYDAQNALGVEYTRLGRYSDAERALELAKELNPNVAAPLINLGILYLEAHDRQREAAETEEARSTLGKAVESLEEATRREALSAPARYFLGSALYKTGSYERAALMLYRALELDEEMHSVRLMLVNVQVAQQDYRGALEQLTTYLARSPDGPERSAVQQMKAKIEAALEPSQ